MEQNNIPTAEDFLDNNYDAEHYAGEVYGAFAYPRLTVLNALQAFAKLHVQEALKVASQVHLSGEIDRYAFDKMGEEILSEDALEYNQKQILNAYPLDQIK